MSDDNEAVISTNEGSLNFVTRSAPFRKLTKWAFSKVDANSTGSVNKDELYAGVLLVHLRLARYTGSAACYPPTREVVGKLFEAADHDKNGRIDEKEFMQIMVICFAQISSRLLVYYAIIILLVPYAAENLIVFMLQLDNYMGWDVARNTGETTKFSLWFERVLTWNQVAEKIVYYALFFLLVPLFFDWIDRSSEKAAAKVPSTSDKIKSS